MSYTLADVQAGIQARGFAADATSVALQTALVNSTGRNLTVARRWRWREATANLATVVGNSAVDITGLTALQDLDTVRLALGTTILADLTYWDTERLREHLHVDRVNAQPRHWTRYAGGLLVYPLPDQIYTIPVDYLKKWTLLSAGGDVPIVPEEYQELLVYGPLIALAHRERDWNEKAAAQSDYNSLYAEMAVADGRQPRQTSSRVVESGFFPTEGHGYWPFS